MTAGVGKYYSQQDLRFTYQVADVALPNLHTEVWVNGSKLYDSGAHPQGTTSYDVWIDLATVTNGTVAEVEVWSNQVDSIARTAWHFSQYTIFTLTAQPNDSSIYATPATTPTPDVLLSDSALNTYLNNLAAVVSAAKARIDAQPNFYGRVRAQRKYISRPKVDAPDDFAAKRNPIRFWRGGDALVVNGRNVSMAYGGIEIPLNDRGAAYWDYKFVKSNQIIDGDKVGQQVVWLDTVPGVYRGTAYYLTGEVRWAEESLL